MQRLANFDFQAHFSLQAPAGHAGLLTIMDRNHRKLIVVLGALGGIGPFSIDMYLAAFPQIAADLGTDLSAVGLSLTGYFAGISLGQPCYGPLLDRFGRRAPLLIGLLLYLVATLGCMLAPNLPALVGFRILQGMGGCAGIVAGRVVVRDNFASHEIARVLSLMMLVFGLAPIIAPVLGTWLIAYTTWRDLFAVLVVLGAAMLVASWRWVPQSRAPDPTVSLHPRDILREYVRLLATPSFRGPALACAGTSAALFAYISGAPRLFMETLSIPQEYFGYTFSLNAIGLIAGSQLNARLLRRHSPGRIACKAALIQMTAAALLVAVAAMGLVAPAIALPALLAFVSMNSGLNPNATALALRDCTENAGRAVALLGAMQMLAGALSSSLVSLLDDGSERPMFLVMALCATLTWVALRRTGVDRHLS